MESPGTFANALTCNKCSTLFFFFAPRHLCRFCLQSFCQAHSSNLLTVADGDAQERACDACFAEYNKPTTTQDEVSPEEARFAALTAPVKVDVWDGELHPSGFDDPTWDWCEGEKAPAREGDDEEDAEEEREHLVLLGVDAEEDEEDEDGEDDEEDEHDLDDKDSSQLDVRIPSSPSENITVAVLFDALPSGPPAVLTATTLPALKGATRLAVGDTGGFRVGMRVCVGAAARYA